MKTAKQLIKNENEPFTNYSLDKLNSWIYWFAWFNLALKLFIHLCIYEDSVR